jgi:hypothetical protein
MRIRDFQNWLDSAAEVVAEVALKNSLRNVLGGSNGEMGLSQIRFDTEIPEKGSV